MNIVSGQIAHPGVNADEAVSLGQQVMNNFKDGWPGSFYDSIGKLVVTMDVKKKHIFVSCVRTLMCLCYLCTSITLSVDVATLLQGSCHH